MLPAPSVRRDGAADGRDRRHCRLSRARGARRRGAGPAVLGPAAFIIVGLPDKAVAESRERVRAALAAIGLALPPKRITVNLSPADLPKEGLAFRPADRAWPARGDRRDRCRERCRIMSRSGNWASTGGSRRRPACCSPRSTPRRSDKGLICPAAQGGEAAWAGDARSDRRARPAGAARASQGHVRCCRRRVRARPSRSVGGPDLAQVKGQEVAKRALEIAAAGGHNLLMSGPPGAGKSLLAACLPGILPPLAAVRSARSVDGRVGRGRA